MTPQQQIAALMAAVADGPPDAVVPCKANQTHTISLLLRWEDDLSPVPTANFEVFRGTAAYDTDMAAKGKFAKTKVPPGIYRIFFPDIDEAELIEE